MLRTVRNVFGRSAVWQRNSVPQSLLFKLATRAMGGSAAIDKVSLDRSTKFVSVAWKSEVEEDSSYPFVWLRDNCRCPKCFDSIAEQRLLLMSNFDVNSFPKSVTSDNEGSELNVVWQDDHQSQFTAEWLKNHRLPRENTDVAKLKPRLWGNELEIPRFDFETVLNDDQTLYDWMEALQVTGLTLITNVPTELGQVQRIGSRVSFLKMTHHGSSYLIQAQLDAHSIAYNSNKLDFHSDLPQYLHMPGIQLLHCLQQARDTGGENQFADGFNIATQLREEKPDIFRTLTTVPIDFFDVGKVEGHGNYFYKNTMPTISLDEEGSPSLICYSNGVRDSTLRLPPKKINQVYLALKIFDEYLYDPRNLLIYKMLAGEMVVFNNQRLLHGRSAYTLSQSDGNRCLQGCFIDWDQIWSRMRSIKREKELQ